jgi:hypothetical protein
MTVKELIEILKTFDQNQNVYTEDSEGPNEICEKYIRIDGDGNLLISQWDSDGNR